MNTDFLEDTTPVDHSALTRQSIKMDLKIGSDILRKYMKAKEDKLFENEPSNLDMCGKKNGKMEKRMELTVKKKRMSRLRLSRQKSTKEDDKAIEVKKEQCKECSVEADCNSKMFITDTDTGSFRFVKTITCNSVQLR